MSRFVAPQRGGVPSWTMQTPKNYVIWQLTDAVPPTGRVRSPSRRADGSLWLPVPSHRSQAIGAKARVPEIPLNPQARVHVQSARCGALQRFPHYR
jgi:hypothetical protein